MGEMADYHDPDHRGFDGDPPVCDVCGRIGIHRAPTEEELKGVRQAEEDGEILKEMFEKTYRNGARNEREALMAEIDRLSMKERQRHIGILGPDGYSGAAAILLHLRGFLRGRA